MSFLSVLFLFIPFSYIFIVAAINRHMGGIVPFNLRGGLLIILVYMVSLIFYEGPDKALYLSSYLDADNYYGSYTRELFWGNIQIFLSIVFMKNEMLYWLFYSFVYCVSYYKVAQKYFPSQYAGYFILCVISTLGFVSFGSNAIRAGFGISLLLLAFCSQNRWLKIGLAFSAVGCNMPMLIPIISFIISKYLLKKNRWCVIIFLLCLILSSLTSLVSDVMTIASGLDARADEFVDSSGSNEVYNAGFRLDFLIYTLIPILFAKYNLSHMSDSCPIYNLIYRTYLIVSALWILIIRVPYTDRFAYLAWFMIPFILLYPVLNKKINISVNRFQKYVISSIFLFFIVNCIVTIKSFLM